MTYLYRLVVLCLVACMPAMVWAQVGTTTFTASNSTGVGATNAIFTWQELTFGPDTIFIGDRGTCSIPLPPYPNCNLTGGTGTVGDPYSYNCSSPLPLTQCSQSGTSYAVQVADTNFNRNTHRQTVAVVIEPGAATPVPLGPWVVIGSTLGIGLLVLLRSRRANRIGSQL